MKTFIDIAKEAAHSLEVEHLGKPEDEFMSWLTIALQREAMVSVAYDAAFVDAQLYAWRDEYAVQEDVVKSLRTALMNVWAQESAHQTYLVAVLREVNPQKTFLKRLNSRIRRIQGKLEGKVLGSRLSPTGPLSNFAAKIAIILGTQIDVVPEYVQSLRAASFSEFCTVNGDLEHTAVIGYERMLKLGRKMPDSRIVQDTAVMHDLIYMCMQERHHESVFKALGGLPPPPPAERPAPAGPFDDEQTRPVTMTLADIRRLLRSLKSAAYGQVFQSADSSALESEADDLGEMTIEVDLEKIAQDPLVMHLREYVAKAANVEEIVVMAGEVGNFSGFDIDTISMPEDEIVEEGKPSSSKRSAEST